MELEDFLVSNENGPYQEYFFIDLPEHSLPVAAVEGDEDNKVTSSSASEKRRRFVYVKTDNNIRFPMSFGNEVGFGCCRFYSDFAILCVFLIRLQQWLWENQKEGFGRIVY
jgi:hypothetical protein